MDTPNTEPDEFYMSLDFDEPYARLIAHGAGAFDDQDDRVLGVLRAGRCEGSRPGGLRSRLRLTADCRPAIIRRMDRPRPRRRLVAVDESAVITDYEADVTVTRSVPPTTSLLAASTGSSTQSNY